MDERRDIAWYHTIELGPGKVTPGFFDCRPVAAKVPWPGSLKGKRCLDVGTFDGYWAFEMERRGAADVVALDLDDPARMDWPADVRETGPGRVRATGALRGNGFTIAHDALGSSVRRVDSSVYDVDPADLGTFDVVLVGAILLHLRDPVRALERLRAVTAGELVVAETIDAALQRLAPRAPAARFNGMGEEMQWWVPNVACLERMLRSSGFRVIARTRPFVTPFGRSTWVPTHGRRRRMLRNLVVAGDRTDGAPTVGLRARPSA
jgi:tRNA (mo5U34)-methyltransferase